MSGGFPTRPQLSDFGPIVLADARPVRDPTIELAAQHWNRMKHQVAGMGILAPRVAAKVTVANPALLLSHGEAWNPQLKTSGNFAAPTPAYVSTGRATLTYLTPVEDETGANVAIAFAWAFGFLHLSPPTTFRHVIVTPTTGTLNQLGIAVFDAAGALQDGSDVWVFAG
jgi:hypothetical protein